MKNIPECWPQHLKRCPKGRCRKTLSSKIDNHPVVRNKLNLQMQMIDWGKSGGGGGAVTDAGGVRRGRRRDGRVRTK